MTTMHISKSYSSQVVSGEGLEPVTRLLEGEKELFLLYDHHVAWAAGKLMKILPVKGSFALDASEAGKNLETVQALSRWLLEADASRSAFLLTLGGGITSDIGGFAAATYKRGIRYGNIPTTLLAQVDAAIGGKTGVNLDGYKNMLGAFHLPQFTYLCTEVLETLPAPIFREGLSELLKTFLLADGPAYEAAVRRKDQEWLPLIQRAAEIKATIVQRDPFEGGERAKLNLGHTFAHAIEHEAARRSETLSHGEAVAVGTLMAAELAEKLGVAEIGLAARLKADYKSLGLPTECPYPVQNLLDAMGKDKKAARGQIKFVLPVRPGEVILKDISIHDLHLYTK